MRVRQPLPVQRRDRQWRSLAAACVILLILPACLVRSIQPWFEEKNFVFEEDLLGGWVGADAEGKNVAMTFVRGDRDNSYVVQYNSSDAQGTFTARHAKFGADAYLDYMPKEGAPGVDGMLLFPTHGVARLEFSKDRLLLRPLDYGQVRSAAKLDRLRNVKFAEVKVNGDEELVFTSTTEEMQRFVLSLERTSPLWGQPIRLTRSK